MKTNPNRSPLSFLSAAALLAAPCTLKATTWTNFLGNMRWGTGINWSPNTAPSADGAVADFQVDVPAEATVGVVANGGGNYSAVLTTLKLGDTNGAEGLTLNKGGATASRLHFTNSLGGTVIEKLGDANDTIAVGSVRIYNNNLSIVFAGGSGTLTTSCDITEQPSYLTTITVAGPGTLVLGAANTYSGGIIVDAATVEIGNDNRLGSIGSGVTLGNSGTFRASGNVSLDPTRSILLKGGGDAILGTVTDLQTLTINGMISSDGANPASLAAAGPGTISILGPATYAGPTIVRGGTLAMVAANYTGGGALVVSNNAILALDAFNNGTMDVASALLGDGGEAMLNFGYGALGGVNPAVPALNVTGTLNAGATNIVINISGTGFTTGQFPLVDYSSIVGNGVAAFKLGTLPPGVAGTLVNNTANTSIDLNITLAVNLLTWYGSVSDQWTIGGPLNWNNGGASYNEYGVAGDIVLFDDTLDPVALRTNINLATTLRPAIVNVTNYGYEYVFSGAGKLSGETILNKGGSQALTISTVNDYSGDTTLGEGVVRIANNSALGTGLLTFGGGGISSTDTSERTLPNPLQIVTNYTIFGDPTANGKLTFTGPIDFAGAGRDIILSNDVVFTGGVTNGGLDQKQGLGTLWLEGVSGEMSGGQVEIDEGALIISGGNIYKSAGGVRVVCMRPTSASYLSISNGATVTMGAAGGNLRLGSPSSPTSEQSATNILDLAGTLTWNSNNVTGGEIRVGGSCAFAQLNLKPGGLLRPHAFVYEGNPLVNVSEINLDGGTLAALDNAPAFLEGFTATYIKSGGAIIDTEGHDIAIAQALLNGGGTGGLTKNSAGKLTLTGANTYTGDTIVTGGALIIGPAHAAPGNISAASGATVGFVSTGPGATVLVPSVTVANGGALQAEFTGQLGNPTIPAASINVLSLNGTVPVNVSGAGFTAGSTVPLIAYTTLGGGGSVTTGQLPQGVTGTIVLNTSAKRIELVVSAATPLLWTGAASGDWDVNLSTNWTVGLNATVFFQGDTVRFDDSAALTSVVITEPVTPTAVVVSNTAQSYSLSATPSGKLTGNTGLLKQGTNTLTISSTHDFSGNVVIEAGTFKANSTTALGDTNGSTTVLPGATLDSGGNDLRNEPITVSGSGWNGQGALISSVQLQNSLRRVTMVGDATFGSVNGVQWGFQDPNGGVGVTNLNGNGFKLTKVGDGDLLFKDLGETYLGDIDIVESALSFQFSTTMGDPAKTCTVYSNGVLAFRDQEVAWNKVLVVNGGKVRNTQPDVSASFSGPATLNDLSTFQTLFELRMLGPISGPGGIIKTDPGRLGLDGTNTYSGSTVVTNGTVQLGATGSIANSTNIFVNTAATLDVSLLSAFALGAGQTLSGNGSVQGNVLANGTVAPGASVGTLTFSNDLQLAGTTIVEITRDPVIANDLLNVSGALTLGGALDVVLAGVTPLAVNDTFDLFNWGSLSGSFSSMSFPPGYTFDTTQLTVDGTIRVTAVPTPLKLALPTISGSNLNLSGAGGGPGQTYRLLASPDLAVPRSNWTPVATNVFDGTGAFSLTLTNVLNSGPLNFYTIVVP